MNILWGCVHRLFKTIEVWAVEGVYINASSCKFGFQSTLGSWFSNFTLAFIIFYYVMNGTVCHSLPHVI